MSRSRPCIFAIGEVLFDAFPDYERLGGAPLNFIIHLHRLGYPTSFLTRVGQDSSGEQILDFLADQQMDLRYVQKDDHYPTGRVTIEMLPQGGHRFQILPDRAYDHIQYPADLVDAPSFKPSLIYFGSLAQRSPTTEETLYRILELKKNKCLVFLDLNLRTPYFDLEIIKKSLRACDILKLNYEELKELQSMMPSLPENNVTCIKQLMQEFALQSVCLTRGGKGSQLYYKDNFFEKSLSDNIEITDTVGAGDGFAAILAAGILEGWSGEEILSRASEFAEAICSMPGAIPEEDSFYDKYKKWFS
jgi:fructokinase